MKKKLIAAIFLIALQSCHVPVVRDYQGTSKSLVFTEEKKWLINEIHSDFATQMDENLNKKIFTTFNELSKGNAVTITSARENDLVLSNFSFSPSTEDLATLLHTDYHYFVNIRTKQLKDQIAAMELITPLDYRKNEAFATVEVYDIKAGKRIYHQKASSAVDFDNRKNYPLHSAQEAHQSVIEQDDRNLRFNYSAEMLAIKNLNKILKDIEKNAIK